MSTWSPWDEASPFVWASYESSGSSLKNLNRTSSEALCEMATGSLRSATHPVIP